MLLVEFAAVVAALSASSAASAWVFLIKYNALLRERGDEAASVGEEVRRQLHEMLGHSGKQS